MIRPLWCSVLVGLLHMALILNAFPAMAAEIKSDEEVLFFPTAAHLSPDGKMWRVPIHAWVFEPEEDSFWRRGLLDGLAASLDLEEGASASETFRSRAGWFLVDNESRKSISITINPDPKPLGRTGSNGHLRATVELERRSAGAEPTAFWLRYSAVLRRGDQREFTGRANLIPAKGLSVISDIDDTVKVSDVRDKKALLRNTFLEPFKAAPGMAAAYRRLSEAGAVFHYVSSSPWQLYPPLADFFGRIDLPDGSFHLRDFRVKDQSFLNLFKSSQETKPPVIESLLSAFPERRFVLIGDSGEVDPEIYGEIARRHSRQIAAIYIRRVTDEGADDARYAAAFQGLPDTLWTLFDDPTVIEAPPAR